MNHYSWEMIHYSMGKSFIIQWKINHYSVENIHLNQVVISDQVNKMN